MLLIISCEKNNQSQSAAIDAIPVKSAVIIHIPDLDKAIDVYAENNLMRDLDSTSMLNTSKALLEEIHRHLQNNEVKKNRELFVSFALAGAGKFDFLLSADKGLFKSAAVEFKEGYEIQKTNYSDNDILHIFNERFNFFYSEFGDVALLSPNENLVKESLRQMTAGYSIKKNQGFSKVHKAANTKDPLNIYFNSKEIPALNASVFPNGQHGWLTYISDWVELDVDFNEHDILMSGVALNPDSSNSWLSCFAGQSASSFESIDILPASAALTTIMHAGNPDKYLRKYAEYLKVDQRDRAINREISELKFDFNATVTNWWKGEMGLVTLEAAPEAQALPRIAFIKAEDGEDAMEALEAQADENFIENHRGYIIKHSNHKNLLLMGYGRIYKDMTQPFYARHDDWIIFGNNLLTLKGYINDLIDGRRLSKSESFQKFKSDLPSNQHILVLGHQPGLHGIIRHMLSNADVKLWNKESEAYKQVTWMGASIQVEGDFSYIQALSRHDEAKQVQAKQLWAIALDAKVKGKPQLVRNHITNKNEIVVQDEQNNLYLIDATGKVLWKKALDGEIMGSIDQVDLYRNNKLQLAFNTKSKLYIVDRLGNDVEHFPVTFKSEATAPVAVFDYDHTRNYRFIVPCGNQVINYSKDGKPVDGWAFKKTASSIRHRPQHFVVGSKDFIVVREQNGNLHLVNRKGEERVDSKDQLPDTDNPLYLIKGQKADETRLTTLSRGGRLISFFLNGRLDSSDIDLDHAPAHFLYKDRKYIITQGRKLIVKDDLNPFEVELEGEAMRPYLFELGKNDIIGTWLEEQNQVWLYNTKGEVLSGFPLYGSTPFVAGELSQRGQYHLVVGTDDGNLVNYSIDN